MLTLQEMQIQTRPYIRQNQSRAIGQEQWGENCPKNAEKTNALPTNRPIVRPTDQWTDTVGYRVACMRLKTWLYLLSMAKLAKLGFGPILALYCSQKDLWKDHESFWGLITWDRHDKQYTAFILSHLWGTFTLPKNLTLLFFPWQKWWVLACFGPTLAQ